MDGGQKCDQGTCLTAERKQGVEIGRLCLDGNKDTWAALASIAETGYIEDMRICNHGDRTMLRGVNQEDIRKLWEASFYVNFGFGADGFQGGKMDNAEGGWQLMMQFMGRDI